MKERSNFWLGVVIGLLLGVALGLGFILIFSELLFEENYENFVENMFSPIATIISTLIIVCSALFGVYWTIKNQNHLANFATRQKLKAARASLPMALSELSRICKLHILQIANKGNYHTSESMILSDTAHETIRTVIENSCDTIQKELTRLLTYHQISMNRYNSFIVAPPTPPSGQKMHISEVNLIVLWASLRALVGCYFDYGRGAKFQPDFDNALKVFKSELIDYRHEDQILTITPADSVDMFSEYLEKESVEGCGFLDPNFLKNGGLDVS